jgi:PrcB C-terminal
MAATDPVVTGIGDLVSPDRRRLYIAVFAGSQRTGGYAIRVAGVDRSGDMLTLRALFVAPAPDALAIQVLTSPAHLVSIERQPAAGATEIVLVDQMGAERARGAVPQSEP